MFRFPSPSALPGAALPEADTEAEHPATCWAPCDVLGAELVDADETGAADSQANAKAAAASATNTRG
ncbi:MAG: hypothetical protein ACJ73J_05055 [Actinomycetes bacterium]